MQPAQTELSPWEKGKAACAAPGAYVELELQDSHGQVPVMEIDPANSKKETETSFDPPFYILPAIVVAQVRLGKGTLFLQVCHAAYSLGFCDFSL